MKPREVIRSEYESVSMGNLARSVTSVAAKVNDKELTVHQINFVLQQQRNLRPEQAEGASKQILERLIDQQLALQKADDAAEPQG